MNPQYIESGGLSRLHLTMALNPSDQVRDLTSGDVRVDGVSLTPLSLPVEEIFYRFTNNLEWDISEMSFAKYISLTARGNAPMVALPVFTSRVFRHPAIYVRDDSGISDFKGLDGSRIGIPEWAQTAGVYVRGMLSESYGVDLKSISWFQGGVNQAGRKEKVRLELPAGIRYQNSPDSSLNDMLMSGELDAIISARPPEALSTGGIRRLVPEFRAPEQAYFRQTGIFPIMHCVVMKRTVFEQNRWIAMNLFKAFDEARARSLERLVDITASGVPLPWAAAIADEISKDFGGDPWPYGVEANRPTLDAFCRFAFDQGVAIRRLEVDELFPVEVQKSVRV